MNNLLGTEHFELIQRVGYHEYCLGRYATRYEAQSMRDLYRSHEYTGQLIIRKQAF